MAAYSLVLYRVRVCSYWLGRNSGDWSLSPTLPNFFFDIESHILQMQMRLQPIAAEGEMCEVRKKLQGRMNAHGETPTAKTVPFPSRVEYIHAVSLLFSKKRGLQREN